MLHHEALRKKNNVFTLEKRFCTKRKRVCNKANKKQARCSSEKKYNSVLPKAATTQRAAPQVSLQLKRKSTKREKPWSTPKHLCSPRDFPLFVFFLLVRISLQQVARPCLLSERVCLLAGEANDEVVLTHVLRRVTLHSWLVEGKMKGEGRGGGRRGNCYIESLREY